MSFPSNKEINNYLHSLFKELFNWFYVCFLNCKKHYITWFIWMHWKIKHSTFWAFWNYFMLLIRFQQRNSRKFHLKMIHKLFQLLFHNHLQLLLATGKENCPPGYVRILLSTSIVSQTGCPFSSQIQARVASAETAESDNKQGQTRKTGIRSESYNILNHQGTSTF